MSEHVICINNESNPASLIVGKIYRTLPDAEARVQGLLRVIDEDTSEPDGYLYSASMFAPIESREIDMIKLRPYQLCLLRQVRNALSADAKARVMMQLPTGGGKTIIAGALLIEWLRDGRKAVWLTHRKELAEQTCRMLTDAHISAVTDVNWTPGTGAPAMSQGVVILMAQTVGRRIEKKEVWDKYGADDLMVIDEAHHSAAEGWERAMRQWPGRIVGMTATPWRLSKKEGFDHLFGDLICGPQVSELQNDNWLCHAKTLLPSPEQRINGGVVDHIGEYTESGIKLANQDRPNVMTAGVLGFWQKHAGNRPTIVYAVSVDHAHNLSDVFKDASIPAAIILGNSDRKERDKAIADFRTGDIKILINIIVATEGFDLPDASCIVIARPTKSLSLYLQMVGRGLRPKDENGNCLILDLAANSKLHGLSEEPRKWSLGPRGTQSEGESPIVWCQECEAVSHATNHNCWNCGNAFGKDCGRCGKWRGWKRWQFETHCGSDHEFVCDLCHIDAHIQAHLPVTESLDKLLGAYDRDDEVPSSGGAEWDNELVDQIVHIFRKLLVLERQSAGAQDERRRDELRELIKSREIELNDEIRLEQSFDRYIATLPNAERPQNKIQQSRKFFEWENYMHSDLNDWKKEMSILEKRPIDGQLILDSVHNKLVHLLQRETRAIGLLISADPIDHNGNVKRITRNDLVLSTIEILKQHGGRARKEQVERDMYKLHKDIFEQDWYQEFVSNNIPRWRHNLAWAKEYAKNKNLIQPPSEAGRGWWVLTDEGWRFGK